ncbi:hypothetical protein B9G55_19565 [Saccharibacillus sp. O16]|nr:hypothetical protein B9G55_19565 [Saccharibacillus sp. O16]
MRKRLTIGLAAILAAAVVVAAVMLLSPSRRAEVFDGLPRHYTYQEAAQSGLPTLHMLEVSPEDIKLRADRLPLRQIPAYGINGGFFYQHDLLSIAVMNDMPVNGERGAYGSGWFNAKYARGTLVWDGAARKFSVQVVSSADELHVTDRSRYWAQGGVSLKLSDEAGWAAQSLNEHLPFAADERLRSALVYNDQGRLWLVVTPDVSTAEKFRQALVRGVPGSGREGIFLDGDGSSQMNAAESVLTGDSRMVVQMISVQTQ